MDRAATALALALVASAAHAAPILYATAATTGEVTSYCLKGGGGLVPDPIQRMPTAGRSPSRFALLQSQPDPSMPPKQFLYAAENDRVEVFEIGPGGHLTRRGRIPQQPVPSQPGAGLSNMNAHDLKVAPAPDGSGPVLYVPERADNRLATFPLDPATGLSTVPTTGFRCEGGANDHKPCDQSDPNACPAGPNGEVGMCIFGPISDATGSSCVLGPLPSEWEDVIAANGLVYAARSTGKGQVLVYQLNPDGSFVDGILVVNETVVVGDKRFPQENKIYPVSSANCTDPIPLVSGGNSCTDASDCVEGQPCLDGACGQPCADDTQCPVEPAQQCVDGRCGIPILHPDGSPVTKRAQIRPFSERKKLNGVSVMILQGNILYVTERFRRAISAFQLCPNSFTPECSPPTVNFDGVPYDPCPANAFFTDPRPNKKGECTERFRQPRLAKKGGRTKDNIRYNAIALAEGMDGSTILGAQFLQGRIDGYRLKDQTLLPKSPTGRTNRNFRTSPYHMAVYRPSDVDPNDSAGVVYVAAGEADRVQAYRLDRDGVPRDLTPFSETTILRNTFPNDVIVIDLPGNCG